MAFETTATAACWMDLLLFSPRLGVYASVCVWMELHARNMQNESKQFENHFRVEQKELKLFIILLLLYERGSWHYGWKKNKQIINHQQQTHK